MNSVASFQDIAINDFLIHLSQVTIHNKSAIQFCYDLCILYSIVKQTSAF
jgi:hypothetical protein